MEQRLIERMENLQKLITVTNLITETRNYKSSIEKKDTLIMRYAMDSNSSLEKSNLSEVLKFNDTIRETNEGSIYYYYWKIMNIHNLLTKFDLYVLSPDFGILGKISFQIGEVIINRHFRTLSSATILPKLSQKIPICNSTKTCFKKFHKKTQDSNFKAIFK